MMKQYLTIILRTQFTLFYRFGYTFIPTSQLIGLDGDNSNEEEKIALQFSMTSPFEYDEEYLILRLETKECCKSDFIQLDIIDIVAIYPLSEQAKISIESKIDHRIKLEKPIFETVLPKIEADIQEQEVKKAIAAIWKICKIESPLEKYIANVDLENIFNGLEFRKQGTRANEIRNGNYWEYLIAYDRFEYFPNSTLGYFYDAGQVLAFSKGRPTFEGSAIHKFLERLDAANPTVKLPDIIKFLETEEELKGYVSQTTTSDIKQYIVAPLYLMLRDEIRNSDDVAQTKLFKNLDYLKTFEDSFNYAVILLGAFFGFGKFYDNYYETLNLRFYKDFKAPQKQTVTRNEEKPTDTTSVEEQNLFTEEQQTEIVVEKQSDISNTQQNDNKEVVSGITKIIEEALDKQREIKLSDMAAIIKTKTGNKVQNRIVENVAKQMSGIEIIKIGKAKGLRWQVGTLVDEQ